MARRRKTRDAIREEWRVKQAQCWEEFEPKLAAVKSLEEAEALHRQAPAPDTPSRKFYSNLGTFLISFSPPNGANRTELQHYLRIIRILDAAGRLKPGDLPRIEAALTRAISRDPGRPY
jgi:hypothetical protein